MSYQRLNCLSTGIHRYRTMRYMMVLGIVLLTIFLYVSYYTTPMDVVMSRHSVVQYPPSAPLEDAYFLVPQAPNNSTTISGTSSSNSSNSSINSNNSNNSIVVNRSKNELVDEMPAPAPVVVAAVPAPAISNSRSPTNTTTTGNADPSNSNSKPNSGTNPLNLDDAMIRSDVIPIIDDAALMNMLIHHPEGAAQLLLRPQKTGSNNDMTLSDLKAKLAKQQDLGKLIVIPKVETPTKKQDMAKLIGQNGTKMPDKSHALTELDALQGFSTHKFYEHGFSQVGLDVCPNKGEQIRLLVLITSAPDHRDARLAIRQTWGHYGTRRDTAIGFMLGRTQSAKLDGDLNAEHYMYGDLIRGNSLDSYNNLTLKTISMLEWVDTYCPLAKFVLKTDDDMFINIPKLVQFMDKHVNDTRHIYGRLAKKWKPIRNTKSKYYVSPQQYEPKYFPDFTTGPAYLITRDVIRDLYMYALNQTYLKLEDVYTTGIVSERAGVQRQHVAEFLNRRVAFNPCTIKRAISVHMVKGREQFDLWKKLMDQELVCK